MFTTARLINTFFPLPNCHFVVVVVMMRVSKLYSQSTFQVYSVQLTLEQHRFGLHGSTYMEIVFIHKRYSAT